jgi:hypothetical protein
MEKGFVISPFIKNRVVPHHRLEMAKEGPPAGFPGTYTNVPDQTLSSGREQGIVFYIKTGCRP